MTKEELKKLIDHEIQWLSYYATRESRRSLTEHSSIYEHLVSIGYTKKIIPLDKRCTCGVVTSEQPITKDTKIEDVFLSINARDTKTNCFSPLETYWILYPEEISSIIDQIQVE